MADILEACDDDMVFPFELPDWIDEKYTNEYSLYCNLTYRSILSILFSKRRTIYHTVEQKRLGYSVHISGTTITYTKRTTYLLALIEVVDSSERMKTIFKWFLQHTPDINFYHPSNNHNSLIVLKKLTGNVLHDDIMELLLQRKEIQEPVVVFYLSACIRRPQHIETVMKLFEGRDMAAQYYLFADLLRNYIAANYIFSRSLFSRLMKLSKLDFGALSDIVLKPVEQRSELLTLVPLVPWKDLSNFNRVEFGLHIRKIFHNLTHYEYNSHTLIELLRNIVHVYRIQIEIPRSFIEMILVSYRQPEQIILLELLNVLDAYKHLLPYDMQVMRYLRNRYRIRYSKFVYYWIHKTYRPGSKIHASLMRKYERIMPSIASAATSCPVSEPTLQQYEDIVCTNPYFKSMYN